MLEDGFELGLLDKEGNMLGSEKGDKDGRELAEGIEVGFADGSLDGSPLTDGTLDGCTEVEGCIVGMEEGK